MKISFASIFWLLSSVLNAQQFYPPQLPNTERHLYKEASDVRETEEIIRGKYGEREPQSSLISTPFGELHVLELVAFWEVRKENIGSPCA